MKIQETSPKVTQPLHALLAVVSFDSLAVNNLTLEQNNSHVDDAGTKQKQVVVDAGTRQKSYC